MTKTAVFYASILVHTSAFYRAFLVFKSEVDFPNGLPSLVLTATTSTSAVGITTSASTGITTSTSTEPLQHCSTIASCQRAQPTAVVTHFTSQPWFTATKSASSICHQFKIACIAAI